MAIYVGTCDSRWFPSYAIFAENSPHIVMCSDTTATHNNTHRHTATHICARPTNNAISSHSRWVSTQRQRKVLRHASLWVWERLVLEGDDDRHGVGMKLRMRLVDKTHLAVYQVLPDGSDGCRVCFAVREFACNSSH